MAQHRSIESPANHLPGMWQHEGVVRVVLASRPGAAELLVTVEGGERRAVNYPALTGPALPGDRVLLNTTATALNLGTGGMDFVLFNLDHPPVVPAGRGHIIKLRYTPWQFRVLSCEEKTAGFQGRLRRFRGLHGLPVIVGELHSMLVPAATVLKSVAPGCRIVYLMTEGAALPLAFSRTAAALREKGIIDATVTCGQAFGGDYEAINVYSGLAVSHSIAGADAIIVTMGPGNAGTGTALGFSGIEVGDNVNRVHALGGTAVVVPRLSFADSRPRHRGISHHTLTALQVAALAPAYLALPRMPAPRRRMVWNRLAACSFFGRLRIQILKTPPLMPLFERFGLAIPESMGRTYREDPLFFDAPAAAALLAWRLFTERKEQRAATRGVEQGNVGDKSAVLPLSLSRQDHRCPSGRN